MKRLTLAGAAGLLLALGLLSASRPAPRAWYRGNTHTHTHTLWSDGDAAPELVARWYVQAGYDFLVFTEHNVLAQGERWFPIDGGRLTEERVAELVEVFGEGAVELRDEPARAMRLRTLPELRERFERPGEFVLVPGEEVTDAFEKKPIHINAINVERVVAPQHGGSVSETIANDIAAIVAEGERSGRPVLAHINHPNFGWGITVEEVASMPEERFFEVYNGHPSVRNEGDATHASMEELWDRALVLRLEELGLGLLYGVATDDAHHYFDLRVGRANTGRGWVVVRAEELAPDALVRAMREGEFYASTGVALEDVRATAGSLTVDVAAEEGVRYTTRFVGTRRAAEGAQREVGEVLLETDADPAVYEFRGDELYVRAVVLSDRLHPNPYAEGDLKTAWVQPVQPGR